MDVEVSIFHLRVNPEDMAQLWWPCRMQRRTWNRLDALLQLQLHAQLSQRRHEDCTRVLRNSHCTSCTADIHNRMLTGVQCYRGVVYYKCVVCRTMDIWSLTALFNNAFKPIICCTVPLKIDLLNLAVITTVPYYYRIVDILQWVVEPVYVWMF